MRPPSDAIFTSSSGGPVPAGSEPWIACLDRSVDYLPFQSLLGATLLVAAPDVTIEPGSGRIPALASSMRRLAARCGRGGAWRFVLEAARWTAADALQAGLIDAISDRPLQQAQAWAQLWINQPRAACALQRLIEAGSALDGASARRLERATFALTFCDDGARAGARAFFEAQDQRSDRPR